MAAEVALGVLHALDLVVLAAVEGNRAFDRADLRVARLDPAVEDADPDALAGRVAEGPVARDLLGPVDADRDALARSGGQAPGGKVGGLAHPLIVSG